MSLKRHFLKKFLTAFSEILVADVKSMLGKVLKVSSGYLSPFISYRENPTEGGGAIFAPQRGAVDGELDGEKRLNWILLLFPRTQYQTAE